MRRVTPVVLFSDADAAWSDDLRTRLTREGVGVHAASSEEQFVREAARLQPDVAVLDGTLEGVRNGALVRLVSACSSGTRIVVAADGNGEPSRDQVATWLGLIHYGKQPVAEAAVLEAIREALPRREGFHSGRVLCIDDDPQYLRSTVRLLRRHGFEGIGRTDAREAIAELDVLRPDVVILDVRMPGVDGFHAAEEIRDRTNGEVPVIFMSARARNEDVEEGYRRGGSYYLPKPCSAERLVNIVQYLSGNLDAQTREALEQRL